MALWDNRAFYSVHVIVIFAFEHSSWISPRNKRGNVPAQSSHYPTLLAADRLLWKLPLPMQVSFFLPGLEVKWGFKVLRFSGLNRK